MSAKATPHPCAFCGSEILKAKKTYCSSSCIAAAKRRRRAGKVGLASSVQAGRDYAVNIGWRYGPPKVAL